MGGIQEHTRHLDLHNSSGLKGFIALTHYTLFKQSGVWVFSGYESDMGMPRKMWDEQIINMKMNKHPASKSG